ncbi:hypothetical protein ECEC1863_2840, partial [Escherichia coli EC1863]
MCGTGTKPPD